MWIIQAALTRSDRTWSSALLSCFSVWQTRCLKSADSPYFSNSYTFIIFTLLKFLCIWVSIFHVLCCSSSLLPVHTLRLPAAVWRQAEVELGRDLCARSCALVHLKSKILLSEPCRKELSRLKGLASTLARSFPGSDASRGTLARSLPAWHNGMWLQSKWPEVPVAPSSSSSSREVAWNSAQCPAGLHPSCIILNEQLSLTMCNCDWHHLCDGRLYRSVL